MATHNIVQFKQSLSTVGHLSLMHFFSTSDNRHKLYIAEATFVEKNMV